MQFLLLAACQSNRPMANPPDISNCRYKHDDSYQEHARSLKPRSSREKLYPSISDINFSTRQQPCLWPDLKVKSTLKAPPKTEEESTTTTVAASDHDTMSRRSVQRCSITSIQTLPSDCSAEDLSAIQAALLDDGDDQEEEQAMSMALVEQMLREELGLTPLPSDSVLPRPARTASNTCASGEERSSGNNPPRIGETTEAPKSPPPKTTATSMREITQGLIYEVLTKLDEVQGDVKSDNWQMLARTERKSTSFPSLPTIKPPSAATTAPCALPMGATTSVSSVNRIMFNKTCSARCAVDTAFMSTVWIRGS